MFKDKFTNFLKININFDFILFFIIFFSFTYLVIISFYSYENFNFTSDFFHHFSVIRNIHDGLGSFEGPKYQYMLGNHTYLLYYLISPLLYLYNDPKILLLVNISSIFFSSYLIYFISKKILGNLDSNNFVSFLIAISFLIFPTVFKAYYYQIYGYQPDTLATPLFLCLFLFVLQNRIFLTLIFLCLLLSVKEEFILIVPALIIFTIIIQKFFNLGGIIWNKKNNSLIIITYILFSFLVLLILFFSKSLNEYPYLPVFWNKAIFNNELIYLSLYKIVKIIAPGLIFILIIYILSRFDKKIFILILLLFLSTFLRVSENVIIYSDPNGSAWANLILAPIHFIIFILALKNFYEKKDKNFYLLFIGFLSYLFLSILNNYYAKDSGVIRSINFFNSKAPFTELISETKKLQSIMIKKDEYDYFIANEYLLYPFMEMSHVSLRWLEKLPEVREAGNLRQKRIIANAAYILIFKKNREYFPETPAGILSEDFYKSLQTNKKILYESDFFLLLK